MAVGRLSDIDRGLVWEQRGRGESLTAIARMVGVSRPTIGNMVRAAGGCRPAPTRRSVRALTGGDREEISRGLAAGMSFRSIAGRLGRAHTSVSREVARNGGRGHYRAGNAEHAAHARAKRPKPTKLAGNAVLCALVREHLKLLWSPQQIAGWLKREYPGDVGMHVSHETIYKSLFIQSRGELNRELTRFLRTGRALRKPPSKRAGQGQGQIKDAISIRERPAEASDRAVPGHWEGDLLMGTRPSGIATLVERATRYLILVALPDGHDAITVRDALKHAVKTLPHSLTRSLTWDRGHEMADHAQFTIDTDIQVYFCDPKSPWQRGTNENTNGLLRQYFPHRKTDFRNLTQAELDAVADQLNNRPRKTLEYMTPSEKLAQLVQ